MQVPATISVRDGIFLPLEEVVAISCSFEFVIFTILRNFIADSFPRTALHIINECPALSGIRECHKANKLGTAVRQVA